MFPEDFLHMVSFRRIFVQACLKYYRLIFKGRQGYSRKLSLSTSRLLIGSIKKVVATYEEKCAGVSPIN
jgi:hypothetical protein